MYFPLQHTVFVAPSSIVVCITFNSVGDLYIKYPEVESFYVKPHIEMINVLMGHITFFFFDSILILFHYS